MEKKMENEMETGIILGYVRVILGFSQGPSCVHSNFGIGRGSTIP